MSPEFDRGFQEKFHRAMISMIDSAEYATVLTRFRLAYEYRRQFPWLEEGGESHKAAGGLAYALRAALATYLATEQPPPEEKEVCAGSQDIRDPYTAVDSAWKGALTAAATAAIAEGFSLERFENRLSRSGVNVSTITPSDLEKFIAAALENYYYQRMVGLSPDPL